MKKRLNKIESENVKHGGQSQRSSPPPSSMEVSLPTWEQNRMMIV